MPKIKTIYCVGCPKFCQKEDLKKLKLLVKKCKDQGYDEVAFNCEAGQQIIKNL